MSRNDENNYTLRPLTIDDAEEYNALLRYAFQVTEQELAETGWKDDEINQSKFPVLQRAAPAAPYPPPGVQSLAEAVHFHMPYIPEKDCSPDI